MKKLLLVVLLVGGLFFLVSCSRAVTAVPIESTEVPPTAAPTETAIPSPTVTPTATPSPTPTPFYQVVGEEEAIAKLLECSGFAGRFNGSISESTHPNAVKLRQYAAQLWERARELYPQLNLPREVSYGYLGYMVPREGSQITFATILSGDTIILYGNDPGPVDTCFHLAFPSEEGGFWIVYEEGGTVEVEADGEIKLLLLHLSP